MKKSRPLSPHLTIYRLPLNAVMSILHRITGFGLFCSLTLFSWWLAALIFYDFPPALTSYADFLIVKIVGWLSILALTYHLCTGIRHLFWDSGKGFAVKCIDRSNWFVIAAVAIIFGSFAFYIGWS